MAITDSTYTRNKKIISIVVVALFIGLLVLVILGILMFGNSGGTAPKPTKISPTPTPKYIEDTPIPTPEVSVNEDAKVFYILNESNKQPGILMSYDPNNQGAKEQSLDTKMIYLRLLDISNDNAYLAYINNNSILSFLELKSMTSVFTDLVFDDYDFYWLDDNNFAVITQTSINKFNPQNGKLIEDKQYKLPEDSFVISVSKDLNWVLAKENERLHRTYLYNLETSKPTYLELYDLGDEIAFNYLNWLYPNKLIFFNSIGLSSLDPSSMVQNKLLSLNITQVNAEKVSKLKPSANGYNFYIVYDGKLFSYSKDNLLAKQILDLNNYQFYNQRDFAVSPNEKFASFDRRNGSAIVINLKTLVSYPLCDLNCYYPVWEK